MAERKVLNKYYPPNFDPSFITKKKTVRLPEEEIANQGGSGQHKVRLMAPFSMRCETCGGYIYKGTKFNARKETARGETYYTIKIYRFYIRCPTCSSEITFKTDPKNTDYVAEVGATRNFEPWREDKFEQEEKAIQQELDEFHDPMKGLENRTLASKREMEIMEALDDLRTRNAKLERTSNSLSNSELVEENDKLKEEEDERYAKKVFGKKKARLANEEDIVNQEIEISKDELDKHIKKLKGDSGIKNVSKKEEPKISATNFGVLKKKQIPNTLLDLGDVYSDSD